MKDKSLIQVAQPHAYFHELVTQALGKQRVSTRPETEFYLVNLLGQFMTSENLALNESLALMIKSALEEPAPAAQSQQFKKVGDTSLYLAGFFQDSLNRKLVDVDYYIGMGGTAYSQVALRAEEELLKSIYKELAEKFAAFVDVLAEISSQTAAPRTEKDILRLYEVWLRTGSERAARALQEAGITPNATIKKDVQ